MFNHVIFIYAESESECAKGRKTDDGFETEQLKGGSKQFNW